MGAIHRHHPENWMVPVTYFFYTDQIKSMLIEKGVKEIATFEKRQRMMQPLHQNEVFV